ncbi:MAG: carboxypeptidase-like regulatory domain-containing protein [Chitinophagales bacterium]
MRNKIWSLFWICFLLGLGKVEAQLIVIKGRITDDKKKPIYGASVQVKGANAGVSTDSLGQFQLQVKATAVLLISAVGYTEETFKVHDADDQTKIDVALHSDPKLLKEAVVKGSSNGGAERQMEPINQQVVGSTILDFRESQNLFTGNTLTERLVQNPTGPGATLQHTVSSSPNGTVYTGAAIPVFSHKEDTKGTRFMFEKWVTGTVVDSGGNVFNPKNFIYNYDKVTRNLLLTQDMNQVVEIEKEIVHSFTLKGDGVEYTFEKVNVIDKSGCLLRLVNPEGKYGLYKFVKVKFVKSDYHSDGMVESGNPYDEYVDQSRYFILYPDGTTFHELTMKMKALRELLSNEGGGKAGAYLKEHRYDPVNEEFLVTLVTEMNK